jgi:YesN/AraC family two-component response regulator
VLEAEDGHAALALLQQPQRPVHLLLTDVVMPFMSGRELVRRASGLYHEVRVLYMSGYTDEAIVQHGVLEPGIAFIQKPFSADQLLTRIREVLEQQDS